MEPLIDLIERYGKAMLWAGYTGDSVEQREAQAEAGALLSQIKDRLKGIVADESLVESE